ncbi:CIC11C00000003002 [Sungouiella intermedia]|uniref:CIC11C00000003002 n=1 Tax=Sungouiella intermedia TaxID=45354 RepID=A0A1L0E271_9ASCO|nr:CIC11C00000003002 [[Candida] intermedia]SGZ58654.1 CIC11C00000005612 [[Candida] intermedia]
MSEPSTPRKVLQISCSIVWCLLAAGPVFGFAALKPILISEGVYQHKCDVSTDSSAVYPCTNQDLLLNFLFTVACMVTNISALPVGSLLDTYGPQVTGTVGSAIIFLGGLTLLFASKITAIDGYLCGYTLLALGGPFVFISCFQLANSFPKNSGLILALLTGAFDSSSALFLIYRIIYTNYFHLSVSKFFFYYLVVPVFIFVCQITIMPHDSYKTIGTLAKIAETAIDETGKPLNKDLLLPVDRNVVDDSPHQQPNMNEHTSLLIRSSSFSSFHRNSSFGSFGNRRDSTILRASRSSLKSVYEQRAEDKLYESTGGVFGIMHGYTITEQLKSPWFTLMTVFTTIQMLRINYFVATIRAQELFLYDNEELAISINHFFDLALPLGGLCAIPFIGLILDNVSTLSVLWILSAISIVVGVCGCLSWLPATYLGIVLLVLYRPFYYTAVSDFCAKVFGFETFGTVYGTIICFSGLCNILQQVMDKVTHTYFDMNPIPINSLLTGLTVIFAGAIIIFVKSQEMAMKRKNLELEAQEASLRVIPH